jgi:hypothetical protein
LAYAVLRTRLQRGIFLVIILMLAVAISGISAGLSYGPEHAMAWLTLPVQLGLLGAAVAGALCLLLSARSCIAVLLLALVAQLFMLNLAPASPYFAQTLQTWEQWLGWLWPFVAVAYVMGRISKPNVN